MQNIKVYPKHVQIIDSIKGNNPRNKVIDDALRALTSKPHNNISHNKIDNILKLVYWFEDNAIVPVDKQPEMKRRMGELRRMVGILLS